MSVQLVIPMAGKGTRFSTAGYKTSKPFIDILGKPMFARVLDNLKCSQISKVLLIILASDEAELLNFKTELNLNFDYLVLDQVTDGAARSVLLGLENLNQNEALLIANSDQIVDFSVESFLTKCFEHERDGVILTMQAETPEWSYVNLDAKGLVTKVAEKQVISNQATVGIYFFRKAVSFKNAASRMMANNDRTNNEFYVAPVYNYLIAENKKIDTYDIGAVHKKMFSLGTPEHLEKSLLQQSFRKVIGCD